jgi:hypothetical protein
MEVNTVPHSQTIVSIEKFESCSKNIDGINPKLEKNTSDSARVCGNCQAKYTHKFNPIKNQFIKGKERVGLSFL